MSNLIGPRAVVGCVSGAGGGEQSTGKWLCEVVWEDLLLKVRQGQGDGDWLQEEEDGDTATKHPGRGHQDGGWLQQTTLTADWTGRKTPNPCTRRGWADSTAWGSWDLLVCAAGGWIFSTTLWWPVHCSMLQSAGEAASDWKHQQAEQTDQDGWLCDWL